MPVHTNIDFANMDVKFIYDLLLPSEAQAKYTQFLNYAVVLRTQIQEYYFPNFF